MQAVEIVSGVTLPSHNAPVAVGPGWNLTPTVSLLMENVPMTLEVVAIRSGPCNARVIVGIVSAKSRFRTYF